MIKAIENEAALAAAFNAKTEYEWPPIPFELLPSSAETAPYGPMCRNPKACVGKGYCPLDPTCGD